MQGMSQQPGIPAPMGGMQQPISQQLPCEDPSYVANGRKPGLFVWNCLMFRGPDIPFSSSYGFGDQDRVTPRVAIREGNN